MLRKFEKIIAVVLVLSLIMAYAAPFKVLAVAEEPESHVDGIGSDGKYHIWTWEKTCSHSSSHTHDESCNTSTLTCIKNEHTHDGFENSCVCASEHTDECFHLCTEQLFPNHWSKNPKVHRTIEDGKHYVDDSKFIDGTWYCCNLHAAGHSHSGCVCILEAHTHNENCYTTNRTCGYDDCNDNCYGWVDNKYDYFIVTFVFNNGVDEPYNHIVVPRLGIGTDITAPIASYTGHIFMGWNLEPDGSGTKYNDDAIAAITETTTLYAQWTAEDADYKVEHYLEQDNGEYVLEETEDKTGTAGVLATAVTKDFSGYYFDSNNSGNVQSGTIKSDGSLVLKLYYNIIPTFRVVYVYTNSDIPEDILNSLPVDTNLYEAGVNVTALNPSINSYTAKNVNGITIGEWTFDGWDNNSLEMTADGIVFTGTWTFTPAPQHTITYYVNDEPEYSETLYEGELITFYEYPRGEHFDFDGWYDDANYTTRVNIPESLNGNLDVYGKTIEKTYDYEIRYFYNGDEDLNERVPGSAAINTQITYTPKPRTGYTLVSEPAPLTITADKTDNVINVYYVYAEYAYTIEYYYNGDINPLNTEPGTAPYGSSIDQYLPKNDGYAFSRTENFPLTITSNPSDNVIRVYYVTAPVTPVIPEDTTPPEDPIIPNVVNTPVDTTETLDTADDLMDIQDSETPLADTLTDGLFDIFDLDVPLGNVPYTGDENIIAILAGVLGISSVALGLLFFKSRAKKDAECEME